MTHTDVSKKIYLLTLAKEKFLKSQREVDEGEFTSMKTKYVCIAINYACIEAKKRFPDECWNEAAEELKERIQANIYPHSTVAIWLKHTYGISYTESKKNSQSYRANWIDQMISLLENF